MNIHRIIAVIPVMAMLCACQSEAPQEISTTKRIITVRATLPEADNTRSHITYGHDDINEEIFKWHPIDSVYDANDYITVFNVSKLAECPYGVALNATKINGISAVFESAIEQDHSFNIEPGDTIFVSYWDATSETTNDGRKIFNIELDKKPQLIVEDPYEDSYMTFMQGGLKMYGIVIADKKDEVPDIHFNHLSSIIRVTLRNKTGDKLWPKNLRFESPGKAPFFAKEISCSVDPDSSADGEIKIREEKNLQYVDSVSVAINNYTAAVCDKGTFLDVNQSYDLYLIGTPRLANTIETTKIIITLEGRRSSSDFETYEWSFDSYNRPIEAGKRYWFKLTAGIVDGEKKLMLNSQWNALHPEDK